MKIPDFINILSRNRKRFKIFLLQKYLANLKSEQKQIFENLKKGISDIYYDLKQYDIERFLTPFWNEQNEKLEKELFPDVPFSFLRNSIITYTMFVTSGGEWCKSQLNFLKNNFSSKKLKRLLIEDYVGVPILLNFKYVTSHNSIHHLYHIIRFLNNTKCDLKDIKTIIEWGGGYGNMAKIFNRLTKNNITYIIIDTPLMSCIQWLYLATILGKKKVKLIQNSNEKIIENKRNILPLCFMDQYDLSADLFISTWALTESSRYSQEYVVNSNWFGSKHILLSYNYKNSCLPSTNIEEILKKKEFTIENIDYKPGNRYAFL